MEFPPFCHSLGSHPALKQTLIACGRPKSTNEVVQVTFERIKMVLEQEYTSSQCAQNQTATLAIRLHQSKEYEVRDEVVLNTKNITD